MSTTRFARCFLLPDGNMCCEHWNGSYIVFPAYGKARTEKSSTSASQSEEVSVDSDSDET
ncbi:MAG TPA: hypothetical protein VJI73_02760 [Candidatus Paceibacterota bacterium]